MDRVQERFEHDGKKLLIREAQEGDAASIQALFQKIYKGKYPLGFGTDHDILKGEIADIQHYLWIVTEDLDTHALVGTMMCAIDPTNRMGKGGGGTVLPEYRHHGLASKMLRLGVDYLTKTADIVDVIYGTSRTTSEGPSRMMADAGFKKMGIFPNAVHIEELEHLNLDVFLTESALERRRKKPFLFAPFFEIYSIARKQLRLEAAHLVTEREPLMLSKNKLHFTVIKDEKAAIEKFRLYSDQKRISNSFFPFHMPNWLLTTADNGTDVFIWYGGVGKQASILGFRTDQVNVHDLLDSVAIALQKAGAAYVELLVDAYNFAIQQEAYTARFIPSAYFPAMRYAADKKRDDYFVVSRTFQILDFTNSYVPEDNLPYLKSYMRFYNQLYIEPLRRNNIPKKSK